MEDVLELVAEGRLSVAEAEPILAALDDRLGREPATEEPVERDHSGGVSRTIRLEVSEGGRVAVKVRLPASIGDLGLEGLPGFTRTTVDRIRAAVRAGAHGAVFESIDDDGDGVRIVLE
jgi:hypothetical protein